MHTISNDNYNHRNEKKNRIQEYAVQNVRDREPSCVQLDREECRNPLFHSCQRPWFNFMFLTMATAAATAATIVVIIYYTVLPPYNKLLRLQ